MTKWTAQALVSDRGVPTLRELACAAPAPGEVLVAIKASGLCHTDLKACTWPGSFVLGHEGAGVIEQVGTGVTLTPGQRVVLNWAMPCGSCFQCSSGGQHRCERQSPLLALQPWSGPAAPVAADGSTPNRAFGLGTLATHTVVPASAVWPIGDDVPFASAAILGCGVMTGVGSVLNVAQVQAGDHVVVIGCGGVGLSAIQAARIAGAASVIGVDLSATRRAMAEQFGATHVIAPESHDAELVGVAATVRALTGGRGADSAFECTGVAALAAAPLRMIRHGGTAVQISGFDTTVPVDLSLFMFDKTYVNPLYGHCAPARDLPRLLELYRSGRLLLDEMVTRTYTVDDWERAWSDLIAGRNAKGVVVFD